MTQPHESSSLNELRKRIDETDLQILELMNLRAGIAVEVGHVKKTRGAPIHSAEREAEVLKALKLSNQGPLTDQAIESIFCELIKGCSALEQQHSD